MAPLGLAELADYRWRKRAGQPKFRLARKAEARDDWAAVVASCRDALAADPLHLEAAWLLAVGHAKLGQLDQVLAPLTVAVAGDFGKWGHASLEQPALAGFRDTAVGAAWRRAIDRDRQRLAVELARAAIVTADGELFGFVPTAGDRPTGSAGRWYRLTRTSGRVLGALAIPPANKIAYVARATDGGQHQLAIGVVDLARGTATRPIALGVAGPIAVAYSTAAPAGVWIGSGAAAMTWRRLDDDFRLRALPARAVRPPGPWLSVTARATVRLHATPPDLTADWDSQGLASAMRIRASNRVVAVPSPGLIDGTTAVWSPDRVHVAFVAQLDDHCTEGAVNTAAFVADASTGGTRELERAAGGITVAWLGERKLVIAGDGGVAIRGLDDAPAIPINGATGLLIPRERPRCAPSEPPAAADEAPDDPDAADTGELGELSHGR